MTGFGRVTGCDLADLSGLSVRRDDLTAPVFDRRAALLALELAAVAYDYRIAPWRQAGWGDILFLVGDRLMSAGAEGEGFRQRVLRGLAPYAAQRIKTSPIPLEQARQGGGLRLPQVGVKALTMTRALDDGRVAIAIGFMGTGKRLFDWMPNLRFEHADGFHLGFLALAQQFLRSAALCPLPEAAAALGLDRLSLYEAFERAEAGDRRLTFFMAGHSQGAAILQLVTHALVKAGVPAGQLLGYGFASPSVAMPGALDQGLYPLIHIINNDDLIPRIGLFCHAGTRLVYTPDAAFRQLCYRGRPGDPLFDQLLDVAVLFRGTADALFFECALISAIRAMSPEEQKQALGAFKMIPDRLLAMADQHVDRWLTSLLDLLKRQYRLVTGDEVNEADLDRLSVALGQKAQVEGVARFTNTLLTVSAYPHSLAFANPLTPGTAPYTAIIQREWEKLVAAPSQEPVALLPSPWDSLAAPLTAPAKD